jgi:D-serine deaminase-like pyridoxal phosphate-dependent protein
VNVSALDTPAALVDVSRMHANLERVASYCREHGFAWRPHVKTHKTPELGAAQMAAGAGGLSVATPREAEVMAGVSSDLLFAYPPVGRAKLERLLNLPDSLELTVGLDSLDGLVQLASRAAARGRTVGVLVEIDVGLHRVGVQAPEEAVDLACQAERLDGVVFRGVMLYPGHIRGPVKEQGPALQDVSRHLERVLDALDNADLAPAVVSGGSTPTLFRSHEVTGLTEIRAGSCIFNDRAHAAIGASRWDDCAYTVLATVVSTAVPGRAVLDSGSKALAREELRGPGGGYGVLLDRPEVTVSALSEEHGVLDLSASNWRPLVGDRVRVIPNHVCVSVNLQDRLYGVSGEQVTDIWDVVARGRDHFKRQQEKFDS